MATITARNGQQYTVPDAVEDHYLAQGFTRPGATAQTPVDYAGMKVGELRDLVAARNEGRDEADRIVLAQKEPKADVIAALEADDVRTAAADVVDEPAEQQPAEE